MIKTVRHPFDLAPEAALAIDDVTTLQPRAMSEPRAVYVCANADTHVVADYLATAIRSADPSADVLIYCGQPSQSPDMKWIARQQSRCGIMAAWVDGPLSASTLFELASWTMTGKMLFLGASRREDVAAIADRACLSVVHPDMPTLLSAAGRYAALPPAASASLGLYSKYTVIRNDGRDGPDRPRHHERGIGYFVLDLLHDPLAVGPARAYAAAARQAGYDTLADEMDALIDVYGRP